MQTLKFLLVDTVVVIRAHQVSIWDELKTRCRVAVPATVICESQYFVSERQGRLAIDLQRQVDSGEINCLEATADELLAVVRDFVPAFNDGLHEGEKEALGLLCGGRYRDYLYCTGDISAVQAGGMLGVGASLVSLEKVVDQLGLRRHLGRELPRFLNEQTLQHHLTIGQQRRITREYFRK